MVSCERLARSKRGIEANRPKGNKVWTSQQSEKSESHSEAKRFGFLVPAARRLAGDPRAPLARIPTNEKRRPPGAFSKLFAAEASVPKRQTAFWTLFAFRHLVHTLTLLRAPASTIRTF